jgi:hypothetical protein
MEAALQILRIRNYLPVYFINIQYVESASNSKQSMKIELPNATAEVQFAHSTYFVPMLSSYKCQKDRNIWCTFNIAEVYTDVSYDSKWMANRIIINL